MLQFLKGPSLGLSWTWVSLAHTGHVVTERMEDFARNYFTSVLAHPDAGGVWMDIDQKTASAAADVKAHPTLAAWLPDSGVAREWSLLHQP
jgi:hypothetical protein